MRPGPAPQSCGHQKRARSSCARLAVQPQGPSHLAKHAAGWGSVPLSPLGPFNFILTFNTSDTRGVGFYLKLICSLTRLSVPQVSSNLTRIRVSTDPTF